MSLGVDTATAKSSKKATTATPTVETPSPTPSTGTDFDTLKHQLLDLSFDALAKVEVFVVITLV